MIIINIIQLLLVALWTLFTVYVVGGLTTKKAAFNFTINVWSKGVSWILLSPIKTKGFENINPDQHYIFMANHSSYLDIPALFLATRYKLHFIAKDELRTNPLTGFMLKKIEMIFVDRSSPQRSAESIRKAVAFIKKGKHVAVFPEGTRTKTGKVGPLKRGGFKMAINSNTPIVPVKITGSFKAWPRSNYKMRPSKILVEFKKPIDVSGMTEADASELMAQVKREIS